MKCIQCTKKDFTGVNGVKKCEWFFMIDFEWLLKNEEIYYNKCKLFVLFFLAFGVKKECKK